MMTWFIGLNDLFLRIGFDFIVLIGCNKIGKLHDFFAFDWIVIYMLLNWVRAHIYIEKDKSINKKYSCQVNYIDEFELNLVSNLKK